MVTVAIIILYILIIFIDLKPIIKEKKRKEVWVYSVILLISFSVLILKNYNIIKPSIYMLIKDTVESLMK